MVNISGIARVKIMELFNISPPKLRVLNGRLSISYMLEVAYITPTTTILDLEIYSSSLACNASAAIRSKSRRPLLVILLPPDFLFGSNTPIFSRDCKTFRSTLPLPSK